MQKSPDDVFKEVLLLEQSVVYLREKAKITSAWPNVEKEHGREPRHVLQKTVEILDKINRYRKNIAKTGEISVRHFIGRDITPNEVFTSVSRLRYELSDLQPDFNLVVKNEQTNIQGKTPNDIYQKLNEISISLDESLGLRGITPSDVFSRSQQVLSLAKFLRASQHISSPIIKPERTSGKLPNHALTSVNNLLKKINLAERNLWMKPVEVKKVPRRVISPGDVYDAMGVLLAELERIEFRLGLERIFPRMKPEQGKTPDDVIFNTKLAIEYMPSFSFLTPIQQFDREYLTKTSDHVFSVTEHILDNLSKYRMAKGIQIKPEVIPENRGIKPKHVYSKGLESLEKINKLRIVSGLGSSAVMSFPLREITPQEVFDLMLDIDDNLLKIYQSAGLNVNTWLLSTNLREYTGKTSNDVYRNIWIISKQLDYLLGNNVFTLNDVYQKAVDITREANLIFDTFNTNQEVVATNLIEESNNIIPKDIFHLSSNILYLVLDCQRRAGMFDVGYIALPIEDTIKPSDIYNQVRVIEAELTELKVFLGINHSPLKSKRAENKTTRDVYQELWGVETKLKTLLHKGVSK